MGFWELSQDRAGELVQAALTEGVFYDVPPDAWYADAVTSLSAAGIMQGVGGGRFAPERTVTRGQPHSRKTIGQRNALHRHSPGRLLC